MLLKFKRSIRHNGEHWEAGTVHELGGTPVDDTAAKIYVSDGTATEASAADLRTPPGKIETRDPQLGQRR